MKKSGIKTGRREFISSLSALATIGLLGVPGAGNASAMGGSGIARQPGPAMPAITLGSHRISRLLCGSNPFNGYSYMGHHTNKQMKDYYTKEQTVRVLQDCEQAGITAHQGSGKGEYFDMLHQQGSRMKLILLQSSRDDIKDNKDVANAIALVHHGGVTDRLFAEGKSGVIHDYIKEVKDNGLLAGVSAHNPDCIRQIADKGWEVDFFMCSFYFLTHLLVSSENTPTLDVGGSWFGREDPATMTKVMRQVDQPCLGFKILGGGRHCSNQNTVRSAFQFAFENIKPADGVIVGMFPWQFDEIGANVQYASDLGSFSGDSDLTLQD
jgi:hypothetical protein